MRGILFVFALLALSVSVFALPDLTVLSVSQTPYSPHAGDIVVVRVIVKNIGTSTANYTKTGLFVDYGYYAEGFTNFMGPNASTNVFFNYTATATPNPHALTGVVDLYNTVLESNELNNNLTVYMNMNTTPICPNGICEAGENCSSCPADCGTCLSECGNGICEVGENFTSCSEDCCNPGWFCRDGKTKAYRNEKCQVTTFNCGTNFCCNNGECQKDLLNKCRGVVAYADAAAQMQGPELPNVLAMVAMVVLIGIVLYVFIRVETHL